MWFIEIRHKPTKETDSKWLVKPSVNMENMTDLIALAYGILSVSTSSSVLGDCAVDNVPF